MKKLYLIKNDKMGDYEKEKGYASYKTIVDYFVGDIVLCNNIETVDPSIWDNYNFSANEENEEEFEHPEIFQFYLCNVSEYDKEQAKKAGLIFSYSDMLDCDVLLVDHWGTSWDYVLTDCELVEDYEELKEKEENEENENK